MIDIKVVELINCLGDLVLSFHNQEIGELKISNIVLDSRKIADNNVFVALVGEHNDSHQYLAQVQESGAILAIVSTLDASLSLPQVLVQNTKQALGVITRFLHTKWHKPTVSITGSSGKTTTKFILESILKINGEVLCAESSFNNDIGVPLTMFNANEQQWAGIFEMGTNHPGEIPYLAKLVESKVAMLLNVSSGHIGHFVSVEDILHEKSNIFNGLSADGIAITSDQMQNMDYIVNKIDSINLLSHKNIKLLKFGFSDRSNCYASNLVINPAYSQFDINYNNQSVLVRLNLLGKHQVLNALAASLAALKLGLNLEQVKLGLESVRAVTKRMQPVPLKRNLCVIDDSYNANPASVKAAIEFLACLNGKKILILGSLAELGEHSQSAHSEIGKLAKENKINKLLALGDDTKYTLQSFGDKTTQIDSYFTSKQELLDNLLNYLSDNSNYDEQCTILIKGSNYMRMWEVTEQLQKNISENI